MLYNGKYYAVAGFTHYYSGYLAVTGGELIRAGGYMNSPGTLHAWDYSLLIIKATSGRVGIGTSVGGRIVSGYNYPFSVCQLN